MALDPHAAAMQLVAAAGPVSALGEGAATSLGAGAFLGGFVAGALGLLLGRRESWRDRAVLNGSYVGGLLMAAASLGELTIG